jgi:hypothetical protein
VGVRRNRAIGGEEALGVPSRLEALQAPFPLPRGLWEFSAHNGK